MAKNIYENFDFDEYETLKSSALEDDVHIVHNFDKSNPMGGHTFVWARESQFAKGKMIRVAVSFCSPKDQFCRKIGSFNALSNFYNKQDTILLPVGDSDSAKIVARLRAVFWNAERPFYDFC